LPRASRIFGRAQAGEIGRGAIESLPCSAVAGTKAHFRRPAVAAPIALNLLTRAKGCSLLPPTPLRLLDCFPADQSAVADCSFRLRAAVLSIAALVPQFAQAPSSQMTVRNRFARSPLSSPRLLRGNHSEHCCSHDRARGRFGLAASIWHSCHSVALASAWLEHCYSSLTVFGYRRLMPNPAVAGLLGLICSWLPARFKSRCSGTA